MHFHLIIHDDPLNQIWLDIAIEYNCIQYIAAAQSEYAPTWRLLTRSRRYNPRIQPRDTRRRLSLCCGEARCASMGNVTQRVYTAYNIAAHLRGIGIQLAFAPLRRS